MAGKKSGRRRQRGEGAVFQRCEAQYGCPPMETVALDDGTTKRIRPQHNCRGMWIGQLDQGWVDGKRKYATVSARTQKVAVKRLADLKQKIADAGGAALPQRTRVKDWLIYWVEEIVAPNEKPNTYDFYHNLVYNHLIPALGHHWLHQLQPEHVEQMHKEVMAKQWRGKKLTSTTAMHVHRTLHTALEVAKRRRRITHNVAEAVDAPTRAKNERGALTAAQARTLLSHAADDRMSSRWMMALLTGARRGEAIGLEIDRIDLKRGVLDLSWGLDELDYGHGCGDQDGETWPCGRKRAGSCPAREFTVPHGYEYRQLHGALCLVRLKTEASKRIVPIVAPLDASLRKRLEEIETERAGYVADHGLVWCRPDGQPLVPKHDSTAWKDACRAAGVPAVDLHAARHTTATLLLEAGVDTRVVQQIVGHSTAAMTNAYQHVDVELARRGLEALVGLIQLES